MQRAAAGLYAPKALAIVLVALLVLHELIYHVTLDAADQDFPLEVLAQGRRIFVLSHGGLDMLLAAAVAVAVAAGIEVARDRTREAKP